MARNLKVTRRAAPDRARLGVAVHVDERGVRSFHDGGMAIVFNCSYARAAVKSYTSELRAKKNCSLTNENLRKRREKFAEQFHFTDVEVSVNSHLSTFNAATENPETFDKNCTRLLDIYNRK